MWWLATLFFAVCLLGIVVYALPGSPTNWRDAAGRAADNVMVLIWPGVIVLCMLLWCVRTLVLRKRERDPGPIHLVSVDDGTVAPPGTMTVTYNSSDGGGPPAATVAAPALGGHSGSNDAPEGAPVLRLEMYLRERLAELQFAVPQAMPGRPTTSDFVELLGTTKLDIKQPLAVVGKLLRLVKPTHGYQVKATLLRRDVAPSLGVSIEVTILRTRRPTFRTFWADSWEGALDKATSAIGAIVLPLTRRSDRGPWSNWRGQVLSYRIFGAYQQFQRFSRESRYEEAMDALYAALRLDPLNHHLRFQLGLLQEEEALYLDALLTYFSIRQGLKERIRTRMPAREAREFERLELLTRYRATILLGWGERLAEQWVPRTGGQTKRTEERARIRQRLAPILVERYSGLEIQPWDRKALGFDDDDAASSGEEDDESRGPRLVAAITRLFSRKAASAVDEEDGSKKAAQSVVAGITRLFSESMPISDYEDEDQRRLVVAQVRLLFELCALDDVRRFLHDYDRLNLWWYDTEITYLALQLLPAWARVRAHTARHALVKIRGDPDPPPVRLPDGREVSRWPPAPETVSALWGHTQAKSWTGNRTHVAPESDSETMSELVHSTSRLERKLVRRLKRSKVFLDHFNAACTYAVALIQPGEEVRNVDDSNERALAQAAVDELEVAVRVGGSRKAAAQWEWILREDPDLAALRASPAFLRFESERFPSSRPSPVRPNEIMLLVACRHAARLCSASAGVREKHWHDRAERATATDPHVALSWWMEEHEGWRVARELSQNFRQWQTRLEMIQATQGFCRSNGLAEFTSPQPRYLDDPIDDPSASIDSAAEKEIKHANGRIEKLHEMLDEHDWERYLNDWERYLLSLDVAGKQLDADTTRRLAVNRASAWGDLRIAFERPPAQRDEAMRNLRTVAGKFAELPVPVLPHEKATSRRRRLLVVANRTLVGEELRAELSRRGDEGVEFHIVAATFALRGPYDTRDTAKELDPAQQRLRDTLTWAHRQDLRATGTVGDPSLDMGAIVDALRHSGASEILVGTLPPGDSNWLRYGIVDRIREATEIQPRTLTVTLRAYVCVSPDAQQRLGDLKDFLNRSSQVGEPESRNGYIAVPVRIALEAGCEKLSRTLQIEFPEISSLRVTPHTPGALDHSTARRPSRWRSSGPGRRLARRTR